MLGLGRTFCARPGLRYAVPGDTLASRVGSRPVRTRRGQGSAVVIYAWGLRASTLTTFVSPQRSSSGNTHLRVSKTGFSKTGFMDVAFSTMHFIHFIYAHPFSFTAIIDCICILFSKASWKWIVSKAKRMKTNRRS